MILKSQSREGLEGMDPESRDRRVWEKAFELAVASFRIAEKVPAEIGPGLSAQMRIVALSIPSFIARGQSRATGREFLRGLYQARTALSELETRLSLCAELGWSTVLEARSIDVQFREVRRMVDLIIADLRGVLGHTEASTLLNEMPLSSQPRTLAFAGR